jgi:transposase-like protein
MDKNSTRSLSNVIRTNNPLEHIMREIQRRTRVVGAFPDGPSALASGAALAVRRH